MSNKLQKIPTLKVVADETAAGKLRELLKDADEGMRRIARCGFYIEWIAANLPQGQLMEWLEFNCPDVAYTTLGRWRTIAKNMCDWAGFKFSQWENLTCGGNFLDVPSNQLPAPLQKAREKIDNLLEAAKTPKQLFLDMGFKQGELDSHGYPKAKVGRSKGSSGLTKEQREKAAMRTEEERLNELEETIMERSEWLLEIADAKRLGEMDSKLLKKFVDAADTASGFAKRTLASRTAEGGK